MVHVSEILGSIGSDVSADYHQRNIDWLTPVSGDDKVWLIIMKVLVSCCICTCEVMEAVSIEPKGPSFSRYQTLGNGPMKRSRKRKISRSTPKSNDDGSPSGQRN